MNFYTGQAAIDVVSVVATSYTHNQRNIEYKFIFTQETILNYAAYSDIIYIIW